MQNNSAELVPKATSKKPVVLRTRMSIFIAGAIWLLCFVLLADAVNVRGLEALWQYGAYIFAICALTWVFMFGPRVKVDDQSVEIHNILHSYRAHFDAIEKVNIGAMTSIIARTLSGTTRRITAWNAPGVKRDNFSDKITSHNGLAPSATHRAAGQSAGPAPRLSAEARLARDQRATDSYVLFERWENHLQKTANPSQSEVVEISFNRLHLALITASVLVVALRMVL